jgi:methyltransferase (TIGR00027 family)
VDQQNHPVRNISDTARWVAYFRALETQRPDALFHDPYAELLAGELGSQIAEALADGNKQEWAWTTRTYLFDKFLMNEIQGGADLVLGLGTGLDTRPYRLKLPSNIQWVEIDLPEILAYKEEILEAEKPACRLQRISLDLLDIQARRSLFAELDGRAQKIVVFSEGLLIYLSPEEVASLAQDISAIGNCHSWVLDLVSPGQLTLMQRSAGRKLSEVGASFKFAPAEGTNFFAPSGWKPEGVEGMLKNAAILKRAPSELLSLLPEPKAPFGRYPWTGVCLMKKSMLEGIDRL